MIPKILHQVWVGDKEAPEKWMKTWREKHPTWEYVLWDNDAIQGKKWINQKHLDNMWSQKKWHGVADITRYEILYETGGVVMPADSECVNPLDDLMDVGFFTCYENETRFPGRLTPVMGATKGHPFLLEVIEALLIKEEIDRPWVDTGNCHLTETYEKTKEDVTIHASCCFMSNPMRGDDRGSGSKVYATQFSGTTYKLY